MKKLLNISVIAALAILPVAANADITTTDPGATNANAPVAENAPKYSLATADTTDANLATAGYVKGAYNATIKAINKVATTKQDALSADQLTAISNVSGLSSRMDTAESDIDALETAVAGKQDTLTSAQQAAVDSGITSAKVAGYDQLVTDSADFITKDVNDLTNYTTTTDMNTALAGKQDTLTSAQQAAVDSGITSTKVAGYDQLVTDSANYATKAGVLATINASTVPVMATWGSTTATTVSVDAPANFVNQ